MRATVGIALLLALSCESGPPKAIDPVWGKQACAHCSMLVSEKVPSAQALRDDGARFFFDDVGCMVAWETRESPKLKAHRVHSPEESGWLDANNARFASGNVTPMDFGFLAAPNGVSFDEMRRAVQEKAARR